MLFVPWSEADKHGICQASLSPSLQICPLVPGEVVMKFSDLISYSGLVVTEKVLGKYWRGKKREWHATKIYILSELS